MFNLQLNKLNMKSLKFHRAIVAIAMMLIGWLPSLAHDFEVDGVFYNKTSDNTVAATYKGYSYDSYSNEYAGDVVIPSSVNYNGTTYSVTSIGDDAFNRCSSLTGIEIPNSVTSIGQGAFVYCSSLTSVEIGNSVTSIGDYAFYYCSSLTSVIIGNSVTSIGVYAFVYCSSLTSIQIPNSVTSIGDYAFSNCSSLTSIQIPNSVTSIGEGAFYYCKSLTSVEIGNSVTSIGDYAFSNCSSLTSVIIGNSVTSIGEGAFVYCSSLTSIQIPNSVTSIGEWALGYCSSLTSIEIGNSVTSIGNNAFAYCESLTNIVVDYDNAVYESRNGCNAIIETASNTLIAGCKNTIIPNGVTSIGDRAFNGCSSLTSIQIPNSVTSIGDWAFAYCSGLSSIEIPNSVTSIGDRAFYGCSSLTKITCLATNPPAIVSTTFSNYSAELYVPAGCISAYQSANFWKKFSNIIELEPELEEGTTFEYEGLTYKVIVKGEELAVIASENGEYSGAVVIPSSVSSVDYSGATYSVTSIGDSAFEYCTSLTSIEIPNSVTSIGERAFLHCESLTNIQIPNSVTSIGDEAFYNCSSLTSIEIPNSVTSIRYEAFAYCNSLTSVVIGNSLTSVVIGNSVTSIGNNAFYRCSNLTSVEIGNSVTSIKSTAFSDCSSLTSIIVDSGNTKYDSRNGCNAIIETASNTLIAGCQNTIIPNSVTSIGNYAFSECTSLTSIQIPNSVTSIGDWAFYGCDRLTEITCLATNPPAIESTTFSNYSAELYVPSECKSAYQSANYWENFNIKEIPTLSTSIALNQTTATLKATETLTLVATVLPKNATDKSVSWKSSNEAVATVDANGLVTAIGVGETIITATTTDGSNLSVSCTVTVVPTLAESIALDKTEISLEATETATLVATVLPNLTTDKSVEWSSSDESVAVVDKNGVVTAIAVGEATITATITDGSNLSASCKVTVVPTLAVSIELDQTEASVEEKSEFQLTATILPEHTTNKEVAWSSSDKWVASVDNTGLVTMYSAGEVIITATTTDGTNLSATCRINVYSGIDGVEGDDVIVATIGDNIVVKNAQLGSNVRVYAADGSIISSEVATDGDVVVEAPIKGVYIVSVNGKTFKVMVK